MNLKFLSVAVICICMFTVGCESLQTEDPAPSSQETPKSPYQIESATYQDGELTIHYPQLTDMQDPSKEQQLNETIKEEATQFVNQYKSSDAVLDMDYQLMLQTSDTLSVLYTGEFGVTGGLYPSHLLFSTTLNVNNGGKMTVSDTFKIDKTFVDTFLTSPYIDRENPDSPNNEKKNAIIDYLTSINTNELIEVFKHADQPTINNENLYGIFSYYLDEESLVISIQVPHALGDHAEFKLNVGELDSE